MDAGSAVVWSIDSSKGRFVARPPRFIDGIYNYCDRWCERCPLTLRCRAYAAEQAENLSEESRDPKNAAFWESLQRILTQTKELIVRMAREQGVDLDMVDLSNQPDSRREYENTREHPLAVASMNYAEKASDWLEEHADSFQEKSEELQTLVQLEIPADVEGEYLAIHDAVDVIGWYQYQIHVKLCRALVSREDELDEPEDYENFPSDADGSAKVALIAIDRSVAAWSSLAQSLPQQGDSILDLLVALDRLRRDVEQEFPRARAFVRPGFDEPQLV
jgi:hypothetical protein